MANAQDRLEPNRLVDAAEAVLRAATEIAAKIGGAITSPLAVAGTPAQPPCLAPFAVWEVEQACAFLIRLGFLEAPAPRKAA